MSFSRENPFPGINPWMQLRWPDVHTRLIAYVCDSLAGALPDDLSVSAEESVSLSDEVDDGKKRYAADLAVRDTGSRSWITPWDAEDAGGVAVAEPLVLDENPHPSRWVEIADTKGRLITVIEVLSPVNKEAGRQAYLTKVQRLRGMGVSVVEIDLIRGGAHSVAVEPSRLPASTEECSIICVSRDVSLDNRRHEVYLTPLTQALPGIRIPLRRGERDTALAVQPLVDRCYTMGRYWQSHYTVPPEPPLSPALADWAAERLRAAGFAV